MTTAFHSDITRAGNQSHTHTSTRTTQTNDMSLFGPRTSGRFSRNGGRKCQSAASVLSEMTGEFPVSRCVLGPLPLPRVCPAALTTCLSPGGAVFVSSPRTLTCTSPRHQTTLTNEPIGKQSTKRLAGRLGTRQMEPLMI